MKAKAAERMCSCGSVGAAKGSLQAKNEGQGSRKNV
jgi:hypothetical protein